MGRKWENIKMKKAQTDGAAAKVNSKYGIEIYAAAKQGNSVDPEANSTLKFVIERAKQAQVPKHVIERALEKAKGSGDETFIEGRYEGFGPNGSLLIVDTLTSNVNRTATNVRTAFNKNGGTYGAAGSVSYLFDETGVVVFEGDDADAVLETLLEAEVDVRDAEQQDDQVVVYTEPADLHKAIEALRQNGVSEFSTTEITMLPQAEVTLEGQDLATFEKLVDALEADDDVQKVHHNVAL
ncbi:YebC/PmpR family DNA-binding transcriptional regulator [Leuconostoc lactis]|uniref:YebC/PmpR family DNA-binding transcriptional regulator n=1 Tax=Leuconostoc lactis TaxID=1246 RepID=UPI0025B0E001|nr:YebC/PmpR family DNA-binding transcriptional regulator [Leuconostoc lactis]MDN2649798.1 YebC/PmpR family DNA-binding transcriptional regulator [Leuconostoc lactis]